MATYVEYQARYGGTRGVSKSLALYKDGTHDVEGVYNNPTEGDWALCEEVLADLQHADCSRSSSLSQARCRALRPRAQKCCLGADVQLCTVQYSSLKVCLEAPNSARRLLQ